MRKMLVLVVALVILLSGCGNVSETKEPVKSNAENIKPSSADEDEVVHENETDPMQEIYRLDILGEWGDGASENKETDEWCYTVYKKEDIGCVHVYQYKGENRDIVVPDSFDGYPVTAVLDPRMYTVMTYDPDLQSFTRSYDKKEITSIQFPDTVYKTYDDIFDDTVWYENQPDGEVYIGNILYKYKGEMPSGTTVNVKEGTLGICEIAFYDCGNLEKIIMPDSVIWLDDGVFRDCTALNEVQFAKNLMGMRMYVFDNTPNLTELYIPKSLCYSHKTLDRSSINTVYYEGSSVEWKMISGVIAIEKTFELKTEVPIPN